MPKDKMKDLDERIKEALDKSPIQGYTIQELAEITETPWPTIHWHLEFLEEKAVKHKTGSRAKYIH